MQNIQEGAMYYPFIRGKQFELVMLREMAPKVAEWNFVPIIEPVKGNFPALKRANVALFDDEKVCAEGLRLYEATKLHYEQEQKALA
jgi:hypothetical protein